MWLPDFRPSCWETSVYYIGKFQIVETLLLVSKCLQAWWCFRGTDGLLDSQCPKNKERKKEINHPGFLKASSPHWPKIDLRIKTALNSQIVVALMQAHGALLGRIRASVPSHLLDVSRDVLLYVVLLHGLGGTVHGVLLHVLGHVGVLDHGFPVRHGWGWGWRRWTSACLGKGRTARVHSGVPALKISAARGGGDGLGQAGSSQASSRTQTVHLARRFSTVRTDSQSQLMLVYSSSRSGLDDDSSVAKIGRETWYRWS